MKKVTILMLILTLAMALTACTKAKEINKPDWKAQTINGVKVNIKKVNITKATDGDEKGKNILQITLVGRNTSPDAKPIDAFLMTITNKEGKRLANYPSTNIGATLHPGEQLTGDAFYVLEGSAPLKATYQDPDRPKEKASWKIDDLTGDK